MNRISLDTYYLIIAHAASFRAGCPSRKVGAVITDTRNRILSTGYNSPPRNLPTCFELYCGKSDTRPCAAAHAEISAITGCANIQTARTIYLTCSPCVDCVKAIMTTPIERIVFAEEHKTWNLASTFWYGEVTHMRDFNATIILN